ncbi:Endogenous retrovirus group K member 11 Pol protein, partial [Megadyptes antipodes antipodes]
PLTWVSNDPVWVDQWPMTEERLQITKQLVAEQLTLGHIRPSVSPWNTPIFVIPKKNGKWRLLHDLRKINAQMLPMGALQPGMPSPNMLPAGWHILIVNLKDCFFTIPLHPQDTQRFAFSVPSVYKASPSERYEWVVLPQGMKNSPTLCQLYVAWALQPLRQKWTDTIIYHYMDDILCCQQQSFTAEDIQQLTTLLADKGLVVAPEKVQRSAPWKYLGWTIEAAKIRPQKLTLRTPLNTLTDIQTVLGDIQWVCNCAGISNVDIRPLTELLRGTQPAARILLTEEHHAALQHIVGKLSTAWTTQRLLDLQISLLIYRKRSKLKQLANHNPFYILEWVFLRVQPRISVQTRPEAVAELIRKGRSRILELTGQEPADISIPVSAVDLEWWMRNSSAIQEALLGFEGVVHSQQPQGKLWQIIRRNRWLEKPKVVGRPIPEGTTGYTDAGKLSKQAVCVWPEAGQWHKQLLPGQEGDTLQTLELTAVIWALEHWLNLPLNVVTDSLYVAGLVPRIQDALIKEASNPLLGRLFVRLRSVISQRTAPCAVIHIRSHQWDLGL